MNLFLTRDQPLINKAGRKDMYIVEDGYNVLDKKMEVLILDDDKDFVDRLKDKLELKISHICDDTKYHIFSDDKFLYEQYCYYDLVFLDIDLINESGIDVAKKIRSLGLCKNIVFVSAYEHLVYDSLTAHPFFFLRKQELEKDLDILIVLLKEAFKSKKIIQITSFGKTNVVSTDHIIYISIESKMLKIYTLQGKVYYDCRPLKTFLEEVYVDNFIQINQSCVINVDYMLSYDYNEVILVGDIHLSIGRTYKKSFPKAYQNFLIK